MGTCPSKSNNNGYIASEKEYRKLAHKVTLLQQEIKAMMSQREEESNAYERQVMAFTYKESEWKRERKKLRDEIRRLRRSSKDDEKDGTTGFLVEQMREEMARRDEAVEKWKMLYLAIKAELDHLIQRTHQGGTMYWKAEEEEDFMEDIRNEVKSKDDTIEVLRAQLTSMEQEECRRNREVDILRQSLRIMSSKKKKGNSTPKYAC